jgi:hypothetical protein
MLLREVAGVVMAVAVMAAATVAVVTEAEGIFMVAAMAAGISVAEDATSAAAVTPVAARLRGRVFAAIVLSPSIASDPLRCGH